MANVSKGAKTSAKSGAVDASPKGAGAAPSAARLREQIAAEAGPRGVAYVGNTGHLWAYADEPLLDSKRNVVGRTKGLYIDFGGFGVTKTYFPETSKGDAEYVRKMDEWLEQEPPDANVEKYDIKRLEPGQPKPPFEGWSNLSASAIAEFVAVKLGDDNDANVVYVKECARYEVEVGANRPDVLRVLDGLLVTEAAGSDVFEATVVLS